MNAFDLLKEGPENINISYFIYDLKTIMEQLKTKDKTFNIH